MSESNTEVLDPPAAALLQRLLTAGVNYTFLMPSGATVPSVALVTSRSTCTGVFAAPSAARQNKRAKLQILIVLTQRLCSLIENNSGRKK